MTDFTQSLPSVSRIRRGAFLVGIVALAACAIGWIAQPHPFARAYLFAWLFWIGVSLGSMAIVMLHHLTGGEWGIFIRRIGEAAMMNLPLMAIMFIPIALNLPALYPWARPAEVAADPILSHKAPYMNVPFFLIRAAVYLMLFTVLAWRLRRLSCAGDSPSAEGRDESRPYSISAVGLLAYFLAMSLASVDWIMSRDAHWYSTIFGMVVCAGQALSAMCMLILVLMFLARTEPFASRMRADHFNDLGNLLLTIVILWAYLAFAQLLVIWLGNKQEEIPWYIQRLSHGWWPLAGLILLFHFLVPFLVLLSREFKRHATTMAVLCIVLLVMRLIELYWVIAPTGAGDDAEPLLRHTLSWLDMAAPIGIGGVWVALFLRNLAGRPLIPLSETVTLEAAPHGV
jgi:hypothetical protein